MAADTSSSAAASTPVVEVAAAAFAALSAEPMLDRSVAAEVINSGAATKKDICDLPTGHDDRTGARSSPMPPNECQLKEDAWEKHE
jgi:hypothetical protein